MLGKNFSGGAGGPAQAESPPHSGQDKVTALFVAPEAPYPLVGGGPLRAASMLQYLAQSHTVDAISQALSGTSAAARAATEIGSS